MRNGTNKSMIVHLTRSSAKCPVCGETFYYDPEHAYMIGFSRGKTTGKKVCSYSCMRKWEKSNHIKRRGDNR